MSDFNYEQFRVKDSVKGEEKLFCLECGKPAGYERFGHAWCKEHKDFLKEDPEALEKIVINRLKELNKELERL